MLIILEPLSCETEISDVELILVNPEVRRFYVSVDVQCLLVKRLYALQHRDTQPLNLLISLWASLKLADVVFEVFIKVLHDQESASFNGVVPDITWGTVQLNPAYISAAVLLHEKTLMEDCLKVIKRGELDCSSLLSVSLIVFADLSLATCGKEAGEGKHSPLQVLRIVSLAIYHICLLYESAVCLFLKII